MSWKSIVKGIAPTIAAALGGPYAGVATKYLSDKIFGEGQGDKEQLENYIQNASPEQLLKIKELESDFKKDMAKLGLEKDKLIVKDRNSARLMAQNTNFWPQVILSFVFIAGFFGIVIFMLSGYLVVPTDMKETIIYLLGVLTGSIPMIMKFWFGGSLQDEQHIEKIYNSTPYRSNDSER